MAAQLDIPALTRMWQMLLKGLGEFADAVDRRATAEMVMIRLAYASALPPPGEVLKRLEQGGAVAARPAGGGLRAVVGGAPVAQATPVTAPTPSLADPRAFRDVVALAAGRAPILHANLVQAVHLVGFAEGRIELRPRPEAPRDLAAQLSAMLLETTGRRWTISLSNAPGEATIADQGRNLAADQHASARAHPLVQAILATFPDATIGPVRDQRLDAYGLMAETPDEALPDFAPPEAGGAWDEEGEDER